MKSETIRATTKNVGRALRKILGYKESSIFLALLGIIVLIWWRAGPKFVDGTNIYLVSRQISYTAIVALGVFFVILTAGIDLSVGSVMALCGVTCGLAMAHGLPPILAIGVGLLTGAALGAVNGAIVSYVGVTPFIVTLGMMSMARGAVLVITGGVVITEVSESFIRVGRVDVLGIPMSVIVLAIVAAISFVMLKYTVLGRRILAVGGNEEATELSGINVKSVKFTAYVIAGVFSSVTGILYICRNRSAQPDAHPGLELEAIAAAVIGGTSLMGGEGSVLGVVIGATIMGVVRNGLVLMKVPDVWEDVIIGGIIVLAAVVDVVRRKRLPPWLTVIWRNRSK